MNQLSIILAFMLEAFIRRKLSFKKNVSSGGFVPNLSHSRMRGELDERTTAFRIASPSDERRVLRRKAVAGELLAFSPKCPEFTYGGIGPIAERPFLNSKPANRTFPAAFDAADYLIRRYLPARGSIHRTWSCPVVRNGSKMSIELHERLPRFETTRAGVVNAIATLCARPLLRLYCMPLLA